ncbi:MAG: T9SS C-terminal target domain-containing protein [Flavobacteriia bacterium]|nr:T9SS C-terminal target domain-containing protein [Flavobacteriia bacterium]
MSNYYFPTKNIFSKLSNFKWIVLLSFSLFGFKNVSQAQAYCNNPLGSIAPNLAWQYATHSALGFYTFNATAGCTYQFTYCNSIAPSASYSGDPYITVATGPVSGAQATNDDWCGLGSYLTWTAPSTGLFYFNVGNCCSPQCGNIGSRTFGYRSTNCAGGVTPPSSITASSNTICSGQNVTLTANGAIGTQFWYTGACGGNAIGTGATLTVSPAVTTTYYVNNNSGGQFSPSCASITITVQAAPPGPTVTGNLILCGPGSTVLTASGGQNYVWYSNAAGNNQVGTGSTFTTPVISTTTTYYVNSQQAGNFGVGTTTLNYTAGPQTFTAPSTGTYTFQLWGAQGGNGLNTVGGLGGYATGTLALTAGQVINVNVGGKGGNAGGAPGWNGGGQGGIDSGAGQHGGSGGGASDIRVGGVALANRVIVAGGGAGGGRDAATGVGGGSSGTTSGGYNSGQPGTGGTQVGGGLAWTLARGATHGTLGIGGAGSTGYNAAGGGGGGGSAGTSGCQGNDKGAGGGGGGGSSYTVGLAASLETSNTWSGNGQCIISYNNPLPSAPTLAPDTICANQVSAISITPDTLATSYTWASTGDIVIVSGQGTTNITISSSGAGGTLSVYASNVCGDGPLSTVQTITVLAQPMVTITASAVSVCENEQITLSGNNALTYSWNNGVIDSVAFIPNDTSYTVTGTDTNGCTNTATQSIVIHSLPLVTLSSTMTGTFCGGQDVTLTGTPAGGVYSQVSGPASALISNVFNAPSQGAWTLGYTFTDANGCVNNDTIAFVIDCMVGLDLISANGKMNVYPIPNNGNFTIKSDLTSAGTLELFNVSGQLVYSQLIDNLSEKMIEIKDLTPGIYTVNIKSGEQLFSGKMTVTK